MQKKLHRARRSSGEIRLDGMANLNKNTHTTNGKQNSRKDDKKDKDPNITSIQCINTHDQHGYLTVIIINLVARDSDAPAMTSWSAAVKYS